MPERRRFEQELSSLGLREHENGSKAREVSIGDPIVLDVKNLPSPSDVVKVRWIVPGNIVKDYVGTRKKTTKTDVTASDLEQSKLTFFWIESGKGQTVQASVTRKSGGSQTTSTVTVEVFDVTSPTLNHFLAKTASPAIEKSGKLRAVRFGAINGKHGVHWDWKVTLHKRHAGSIKDLQTIQEDRQRRGQKDGKTVMFGRRNPKKKDLHEQLDQSLWDSGSEAAYSTKDHYPPVDLPISLAAGKSFRDKDTWDSPHTSMEPTDDRLTVNDRFKYFIMFKPATTGAIWVPLAKAEWFWKATAEKSGGDWKLTDKDGKITAKGALTHDFPSYESNVSENVWIEIP